MALFRDPVEHAANPPQTWEVVKVGERLWHLVAAGAVLTSEKTRREAKRARTEGFYVNLYEKERKQFAGESVDGWKPYIPQEA